MFKRLSSCFFNRKQLALFSLSLFFSLLPFAQKTTVIGTVKDQNNNPVDGAILIF